MSATNKTAVSVEFPETAVVGELDNHFGPTSFCAHLKASAMASIFNSDLIAIMNGHVQIRAPFAINCLRFRLPGKLRGFTYATPRECR
jgi:hypothetical protein